MHINDINSGGNEKKEAIFLIDESARFEEQLCGRMARVELSVPIFGKDLNLTIGFLDMPVRICDFIPVAQALCDKIVDATLNEAQKLGWNVPCKKGCGFCCKNLVPISEPEAMWLSQEFAGLPKSEQKVLQRSIEFARRKLLSVAPPQLTEPDIPQEISDWYSNLDLVCPFLVENSCSIYRLRPLACREHIVAGLAGCGQSQNQIVRLPISILESVSKLCDRFGEGQTDAIMLPISFAWVQSKKNRKVGTYYMSQLLESLVEIMEQQTVRI
ncbi:MAG: YkgJ family cysteine cluster protein [Phycisphaerae bacterium]|nr:YkgJ family cysteine cluster protein [Phycisphaerae bacterium]